MLRPYRTRANLVCFDLGYENAAEKKVKGAEGAHFFLFFWSTLEAFILAPLALGRALLWGELPIPFVLTVLLL